MHNTRVSIESTGYPIEVAGKPSVIVSIDGIGTEIRVLQEPGIPGGGEQWNVSEVAQGTPPSALLAHALGQESYSLLIIRLSQDDQPSLRFPAFDIRLTIDTSQKQVEAANQVFEGQFVRVFIAYFRQPLFHSAGEQHCLAVADDIVYAILQVATLIYGQPIPRLF